MTDNLKIIVWPTSKNLWNHVLCYSLFILLCIFSSDFHVPGFMGKKEKQETGDVFISRVFTANKYCRD